MAHLSTYDRKPCPQNPAKPRNEISASGFQEQLQCSKLYGIGGANTYSCVTAMRRETRLRQGGWLMERFEISSTENVEQRSFYGHGPDTCVIPSLTDVFRAALLRTAHYLQQLTFSADCTFFVKKVWRMSPQPVATCTVRCPIVRA